MDTLLLAHPSRTSARGPLSARLKRIPHRRRRSAPTTDPRGARRGADVDPVSGRPRDRRFDGHHRRARNAPARAGAVSRRHGPHGSALALEDDLDEQLGPAIRAAMVTPLFRHDPGGALRADDRHARPGRRMLRPLVRIFLPSPLSPQDRRREARDRSRDRAGRARSDRTGAEGGPTRRRHLHGRRPHGRNCRRCCSQPRSSTRCVEMPPYGTTGRAAGHPATQWQPASPAASRFVRGGAEASTAA